MRADYLSILAAEGKGDFFQVMCVTANPASANEDRIQAPDPIPRARNKFYEPEFYTQNIKLRS